MQFFDGMHALQEDRSIMLGMRSNAKLKRPVTMMLSEHVVDDFKGMADEAGFPTRA
ncbi:hypothetical protein [Pseudorhodoferax sp. Leaf274]|uniref:hypothetical protein n=1 Tax=Pseudorhodoferax sp. Leaf274 TaxID=1736318 RepID=UPI0012E30130|nr:hypothetical protein [Pseudorhodoferax sp. Leaf274]